MIPFDALENYPASRVEVTGQIMIMDVRCQILKIWLERNRCPLEIRVPFSVLGSKSITPNMPVRIKGQLGWYATDEEGEKVFIYADTISQIKPKYV